MLVYRLIFFPPNGANQSSSNCLDFQGGNALFSEPEEMGQNHWKIYETILTQKPVCQGYVLIGGFNLVYENMN